MSLAFKNAEGFGKPDPDEVGLPAGLVLADDVWKIDFNKPCNMVVWEYAAVQSFENYVAVESETSTYPPSKN